MKSLIFGLILFTAATIEMHHQFSTSMTLATEMIACLVTSGLIIRDLYKKWHPIN